MLNLVRNIYIPCHMNRLSETPGLILVSQSEATKRDQGMTNQIAFSCLPGLRTFSLPTRLSNRMENISYSCKSITLLEIYTLKHVFLVKKALLLYLIYPNKCFRAKEMYKFRL